MHARDRQPIPCPLIVGGEVLIIGGKLPANVLAAMLIALR
jgi:hypothetical protein